MQLSICGIDWQVKQLVNAEDFSYVIDYDAGIIYMPDTLTYGTSGYCQMLCGAIAVAHCFALGDYYDVGMAVAVPVAMMKNPELHKLIHETWHNKP